jgi:hypothetical protein
MNGLHGHDSVQQFVDDDEGYLGWLDANPNGSVVNSDRTPKPNYLVLHRATCKFINSPNRSNWTTTGFIKTCSLDPSALSQWALEEVGGELKPCGVCKPGVDRPTTPRFVQPPPKPLASPRPTAPLAPFPVAISRGQRPIPDSISTGCPELDLVWKNFAHQILRSPTLIPDTEDDLNWHAFLGHSIDMQGFRAAEFVGVDPLTKKAPGFTPLKVREIGVPELGSLWEIEVIRSFLLKKTQGQPLQSTLDLLKSKGGTVGRSLAEAFEAFPYRKGHRYVRAYLQNSFALREYAFSFRQWLQSQVKMLGAATFPPTDFRQIVRCDGTSLSLENALRNRLMKTFFMVKEAMAPYMLCDWQLWLWNAGQTAVFANFKLDSFHEEFVKKYGQGIVPATESGFAQWWLSIVPDIPPRLANECIWLGIEHRIV